jgi:hypothetical protein
MAVISFNPLLVTVAPASFSTTTDGYVQGVMLDDPAVRYALAGGVLAAAETFPMWGGVAIYEDIPGASGVSVSMGALLGRALSTTAIAGFSVFNQAGNWITSPQSEAPSAAGGMTVPYVRLGSGARVVVQCNPSLASLQGGATNQQVSWDFNNQVLQPFDASTPTYALTSLAWANTNGGQLTVVAAVATPVGAVGDFVNISGATNTGTGGAAAVNRDFQVVAFTDNQHFILGAPAAAGVYGTIAGSPVLNYGTGALPVKVLEVAVGNSKVISYDAVNNFVHWNPNGSTALILL